MAAHEEDQEIVMKKPLLTKPSKPLGGFKIVPFIIAHEAFEKASFYGLQPNMIVYLMGAYGLDMATGSNILFLWGAATNFTPIIGAFLADSCLGRFRLISFGAIFALLGITLLWSTTIIPGVRPPYEEANSSTSATPFQVIYLCLSLVLMAIGAGGIRSSTLAFGADQLTRVGDEENAKDNRSRAVQTLFNWYYLTMTMSVLFAQTCIVYIQDHLGWQVGFAVPVSLMLVSVVSFFSASSFYVNLKPTASAFTRLTQVIVAAWKNRHYKFSTDLNCESLYYVAEGSKIKAPSDKLRFLNKACILKNGNSQDFTQGDAAVDPWSLCTIDQVEELKTVVNVIPVWSAGIIFGVSAFQSSFLVVQAKSMDRHVFTPSLEIPAGSFGTFALITVMLWLVFYNHVFITVASKAFGKPKCLDVRTRIGVGLVLTFSCLVISGGVESIRRGRALVNIPMSALWLVPQLCLLGLAEALVAIALIEFFYSEFPKSMSSVAANLYGVGLGVSSLVASVIMSVINHVTGKGGSDSWVSSDPNRGHYDYYYWVLAGLSLLNFMYFLVCSSRLSHSTKERIDLQDNAIDVSK